MDHDNPSPRTGSYVKLHNGLMNVSYSNIFFLCFGIDLCKFYLKMQKLFSRKIDCFPLFVKFLPVLTGFESFFSPKSGTSLKIRESIIRKISNNFAVKRSLKRPFNSNVIQEWVPYRGKFRRAKFSSGKIFVTWKFFRHFSPTKIFPNYFSKSFLQVYNSSFRAI